VAESVVQAGEAVVRSCPGGELEDFMPQLALEEVTKVYGTGAGQVAAVRHASMAVQRGELVLLMGPSGSGKTTLLSIMGCMLKPSSGRVKVAGQDVTALGEDALPFIRRQHIGYIFQGFNLFPALTARENIEVVLRMKGRPVREARDESARLLTLVGLEDRMDHLPSDLSGGQKQRVSVARALADAPAILLGDEPTAALDTKSGLAVMALIREQVHSGGHAGVIVTHDPRLVSFADRVLYMEDGQLLTALEPAIRGGEAGT
jgi:putative ABC transport system ATP-binding protein